MAVARMKYLNVYGPEKMLEAALSAIAQSQMFAPESDEAIHSALSLGANPYEPELTKAKGLLKDLGASSIAADFIGPEDTFSLEDVRKFIENFAAEVAGRNKRKTDLENELELQKKTEDLLSHMTDLDISVDELFKVEYLKVRVGRLPKNSYVRLAYYADKGFNFTNYFNFIVYDFDGEYYWGLYFAPSDSAKEIDDIFNSLYFERLWVPDTVHGRPEEAIESIRVREQELESELKGMLAPGGVVVSEEELATIQSMASWLNHMNQIYEMKKYALVFNHTFYISGFVPEDDFPHFERVIEDVDAVHIKEAQHTEELPAEPPVKLKNTRFARPFEMFTNMYGLPGYREVDPTPMIAVIYSVLYGIMFADVGQGIVLALVGYFIMYKKKNMAIGLILTRAAIFCCIFGLLFGSVFGFEELLNPVYEKLGITFLPFHVMSTDNIMLILIASLAIGIGVLIFSICVNIVVCLRDKNYGEALTSPNGVAGLVFYVSLIILALDVVLLALGFSSHPLYMVPLIVIPLIVMYFQEPLTARINREKLEGETKGDILVKGFFELFVTLLEYLANTVSFLRVGGFVLAHAGMMTVVMTLSGMASGVGQVVVAIVGNIFVIALEGLIVGIQALRLNYYEVFSRFYDPTGKPFTPLKIDSDTVEL